MKMSLQRLSVVYSYGQLNWIKKRSAWVALQIWHFEFTRRPQSWRAFLTSSAVYRVFLRCVYTQPSQACSGGHIIPNPTQNRCGLFLFAYEEYKLKYIWQISANGWLPLFTDRILTVMANSTNGISRRESAAKLEVRGCRGVARGARRRIWDRK